MKSYKQLKEQLQESLSGLNYGSLDDGGVNLYAVEDNRVLEKINYALQKVNDEPASDPNSRLVEIKKVLALAALDFDHTIFEANEDDPVTEIPLTQFGGRKGFTPEDGYVDDDGISHRTGGVKYGIRIEATKGRGGLWSLDAKVMPLEMTESLYRTHGSHLNESPMGMGGMGSPMGSPMGMGDVGAQLAPKDTPIKLTTQTGKPSFPDASFDFDAWLDNLPEGGDFDQQAFWDALAELFEQFGIDIEYVMGLASGNPDFNWTLLLDAVFGEGMGQQGQGYFYVHFGYPNYGNIIIYFDQGAGEWSMQASGSGYEELWPEGDWPDGSSGAPGP